MAGGGSEESTAREACVGPGPRNEFSAERASREGRVT